MTKSNPRTPSALSKPLAKKIEENRLLPPPKSAEDAVTQCLTLLAQNQITLKDGSPVSMETLPSVMGDLLGLFLRAQAEAQQLRATLKATL